MYSQVVSARARETSVMGNQSSASVRASEHQGYERLHHTSPSISTSQQPMNPVTVVSTSDKSVMCNLSHSSAGVHALEHQGCERLHRTSPSISDPPTYAATGRQPANPVRVQEPAAYLATVSQQHPMSPATVSTSHHPMNPAMVSTSQHPTVCGPSQELTIQTPPADSSIKVINSREGWVISTSQQPTVEYQPISRLSQVLTIQAPPPGSSIEVTNSRKGWVVSKPTVEYWPYSTLIQELTVQAPPYSSVKVTGGREGWVVSTNQKSTVECQPHCKLIQELMVQTPPDSSVKVTGGREGWVISTNQQPTVEYQPQIQELTVQGPPDSSVKVTSCSEGWVVSTSQQRTVEYQLLSRSIQELTVQTPPDSSVKVTGGREEWVISASQQPTVEYQPLHRPMEELTSVSSEKATVVSSEKVTIGREGCKFSQREDSGYTLQISEGSFPFDVDEVDVTVNVLLPDSEMHFVPEGSELVSGVCHIESREIELEKSGSLIIDHCMDIRNAKDRDSVGVVTHKERRESSIINGSPHFQYVDDSDIDVRSDCVGVKLRKLGSVYYAVCAKERRRAVGYCGLLYREAAFLSRMKFYFIVVKDLFFYVKAVQESCVARSLEKAYEPMPVTFVPVPDDQEMKLTLKMKKEGIRNKGWHIYPCTSPDEILECDAHNYHPKHCYIPSIELQAVWIGNLQPAAGPNTLVQFIDIEGTKRPKYLTLQYEPGRPYPQEPPGANDAKVPKCQS